MRKLTSCKLFDSLFQFFIRPINLTLSLSLSATRAHSRTRCFISDVLTMIAKLNHSNVTNKRKTARAGAERLRNKVNYVMRFTKKVHFEKVAMA